METAPTTTGVPMDARRSPGVPMDAYDYGLPESAIAQEPAEPRSSARLLVGPGVDPVATPPSGDAGDHSVSDGTVSDGTVSHRTVSHRTVSHRTVSHRTVADLPSLLAPGDVLVINDTRVLTARLPLVKATGGGAEVLLLEPTAPGSRVWSALVRPGRRLPATTLLYEETGGPAVVQVGEPVGGPDDGRRLVELLDPSVVERSGTVPLPPYLHGPPGDPGRYQTVYAADRAIGDRSAAAPTAGLHFTPELLDACRRAGATVARLDLVIGLDTFRPITADTPEGHVIHTERYSVPPATMEACRTAGRVVAIGTTAVRALESAGATGMLSGRTDLYIHGSYPFRVVDLLVTNFHLPRSSLLLLVEAFCGPVWRDLYATALAEGYRFLSFGDAMVVARAGPKHPLA